MSDTHDDPLPNPAALDELLRAFSDGDGDGEASIEEPVSDDAHDDGDPTAPSNPPLALHIVEQTPPEPMPPASEAATAPKIIRIDDIPGQPAVGGRTIGVDSTEPAAAPDEAPGPEPAIVRIDDSGVPDDAHESVDAEDSRDSGGADDDDADADHDADDDVDHEANDDDAEANDDDAEANVDDDADQDADHGANDDADDPGPAASEPPADDGGAERAIISIADGELPDAVYVEGNLERSGTRNIVFIEDDDTGDTVATDPKRDARRGIEPRLRERRAAVKRAIGRKRLRWILAVTVVVIVAVGTLAVLGSNLFAIRAENVSVVGAVYTDSSELEAVVEDLVGTPILLADTQAAEERLEAIPWVDSAKIRTDFPSSATIEIREREAMTTYQGRDQRYRVLDREGRVLDVLDGWPIAYVLLTGPDPVDLDAGEFAPQGYAAASELSKNLTGSVRDQVAAIEVTSDGSRLSLLLIDGTEVRFGAARDLFAKLVRLETVLTTTEDREPGVIDVSTREVTL